MTSTSRPRTVSVKHKRSTERPRQATDADRRPPSLALLAAHTVRLFAAIVLFATAVTVTPSLEHGTAAEAQAAQCSVSYGTPVLVAEGSETEAGKIEVPTLFADGSVAYTSTIDTFGIRMRASEIAIASDGTVTAGYNVPNATDHNFSFSLTSPVAGVIRHDVNPADGANRTESAVFTYDSAGLTTTTGTVIGGDLDHFVYEPGSATGVAGAAVVAGDVFDSGTVVRDIDDSTASSLETEWSIGANETLTIDGVHLNALLEGLDRFGFGLVGFSGTIPCPEPNAGEIEVEKSASVVDTNADGVTGDAGDVITYTYTVTNSGDVDVYDIAVVESAADFSGTGTLPAPSHATGGTDEDGDADDVDLAAGASLTFSATYTITAADEAAGSLENQATASGTDENGNAVEATSTDPNGSDPNGKTITTLGVCNNRSFAHASFSDVTVASGLITGSYSFADGTSGTFEWAGSAQTEGQRITTHGIEIGWSGANKTGTLSVVPDDPSETDYVLAALGGSQFIAHGGNHYSGVTISWSPATGVGVLSDPDDQLGGDVDSTLANNTTLSSSFSLAGDVTWVAMTPAGATSMTYSLRGGWRLESVTYSIGRFVDDPSCAPDPLTVEKSASVVDTNADGVTGDAGDVITYTYTVTNSGDVDVYDIAVVESAADFSGTGTLPAPSHATGGTDEDGDADDVDLAAGASLTFSATYTITAADEAAGSLENQATASGTDENGNAVEATSTDPNGSDPNGKTIVTTAATPPPADAVDDSTVMGQTGAQLFDVSGNDLFVTPGADFLLTGGGSAGGSVSIDPDTGIVTYTPLLAEAGSVVTIEYEVCPDGVVSGGAGCDVATLSISVEGADIEVSVADPVAPVAPGETALVTIDVENLGSGDSDDPSVVVYSPPAGTSVDIAGLPAGCVATLPVDGSVTCTTGDLGVGDSAQFVVPVVVDAGAAPLTTLSGGVATVSNPDDPNGANNSASGSVATGVAVADLLSVATDPGVVTGVVPGAAVLVVVETGNDGPSDASNAVVTYVPPTGTVIDIANLPTNCSLNSDGVSVDCLLGTIAAGDSESVSIPVLVDAGAAPSSTLTAGSSVGAVSDATDPDGDSSAAPITTGAAEADIGVTVTDPAPVTPGSFGLVAVDVENLGVSDTDDNSTVVYSAPVGTSIDMANLPAGCVETLPVDGSVTCTTAALAVGESQEFLIPVLVPADVVPGAVLSGGSAVVTNSDDVDGSNNSAPSELVVGPRVADLSTSVTDPGAVVGVTPGAATLVTLSVDNDGPSDAPDTVVVYTPPAGVIVDAGNLDTACVLNSPVVGSVSCDLGTVAVGDSAAIDIAVLVDSQADPNTTLVTGSAAGATADATDPDGDATTAPLTTGSPVADLVVTASDAGPVVPGEAGMVTLTVDNNGPSEATNTTVDYTPPDDVTVDMANLPPNCVADTPSAGSVRCDLGDIDAGLDASVDIPIVVAATAPESGTLTNADVDVSSDATDLVAGNSTDQPADVTTGPAEADLAITIDSTPTLQPGQSGVVDLNVHNVGPSTAGSFDLVYTLPAGVEFDAAHANPNGCSEAAGVVTCTVNGPVLVGVDVDVVIPVTMLSEQSTAGPLPATSVEVGSQSVVDPEGLNDTALVTVTLDLSGDSDGDGNPDSSEIDPDGDGVPDDTDGDGVPDYLDLDSDNDGILDIDETNGGDGTVDTDGDGVPDYRDLDADNDGILDVVEGGNGALDADNDGTIDSMDDPATGDLDGDGVADDADTSTVDTDGDGVPDYRDLDADNDGILDVVEGGNGALDADNDGTIDSMDDPATGDLDGDGVADDADTSTVDTDSDGTPDYQDLDSDNDGIPDVVEAGSDPLNPVDTDGDGTPDFRDLDSDNDGILDVVEAGSDPLNPVDTDGDGTPDFRDLDSDNDGILDAVEAGSDPLNPVDTDGDGTPDFRDLDSDNDGMSDASEGGISPHVDSDGDGVFDWIDPVGASISGRVFFDADLDGVLENEQEISGVVVKLMAAGSDATLGSADDVEIQRTTTASPYTFTDVADGDYLIVVDVDSLPAGVYVTDDSDGGQDQVIGVTVAGESVADRDFGEYYAVVTGVFTDGSGRPVGNAVVTLVDAEGNVVSTTTDADGVYRVEGSAETVIVLGSATVSGVDRDGNVVSVVVEVAGASEHLVDLALPAGGSPGTLAFTGGSAGRLVTLALVLTFAGAALLSTALLNGRSSRSRRQDSANG